MLCAPCNRVKGAQPQEYLISNLSELDIAG